MATVRAASGALSACGVHACQAAGSLWCAKIPDSTAKQWRRRLPHAVVLMHVTMLHPHVASAPPLVLAHSPISHAYRLTHQNIKHLNSTASGNTSVRCTSSHLQTLHLASAGSVPAGASEAPESIVSVTTCTFTRKFRRTLNECAEAVATMHNLHRPVPRFNRLPPCSTKMNALEDFASHTA